MSREEAIARRMAKARRVSNPLGGSDCIIIAPNTRPWIRFNGESYLMARFVLGIELAGTKVIAMHECDNPPCVNPEHLRVGDQSRNVSDRHRRSAMKV